MSPVHQLRGEEETSKILADQQNRLQAAMQENVVGGGGPPHNGDMEARIAKLEATADATRDKLAGIETRLTVIERTVATKEDLHKEISAQTWKLVTFVCGFGSALVAAVYFIAKHT